MLEKIRFWGPIVSFGFLVLIGFWSIQYQFEKPQKVEWLTLTVFSTPTPAPTPSGNLTISGPYGFAEISPEGEMSIDGKPVICSPKAMQIIHHALMK